VRIHGEIWPPEYETVHSQHVLQLNDLHLRRLAPVKEVGLGVRVITQDRDRLSRSNALDLISENKNRLWAAEPPDVDYSALRPTFPHLVLLRPSSRRFNGLLLTMACSTNTP
jgi:hypothetical protein